MNGEHILDLLGGGRFLTMTGARSLCGDATSLQFSLPRGARDGINKVAIGLSSDGVVTMRFYRLRGADLADRGAVAIPVDAIRSTFTARTGLDCTL